jgi:O-antigen ligase
MRPGVWRTFGDQVSATMDPTTVDASSYQYRWDLWKIAYAEVMKSPDRMLFGYGPRSTMALETRRTTGMGRDMQVWSWDNHYANYLVTTGFVGLAAVACLHIAIVSGIGKAWLRMRGPPRDVIAGMAASLGVLFFMMTNVLIFAQQLNYLFWILVCAAMITWRSYDSEGDDYSDDEKRDSVPVPLEKPGLETTVPGSTDIPGEI